MDLRLESSRSANRQAGDLRLGPLSRARILTRPEDSIRVMMQQAPRAEAAAGRWIERTRPQWTWLAREWRRLAAVLAVLIIGGFVLHAMLGPNGIVVYRQKRAEMQDLQSDVD